MTYDEKIIKLYEWKEDILLFLKEVFPHHYPKDFAPFHKEIFAILKDHARIAIAAPRRHGKSESITFGWVMWNLLCNPHNHFTIIISNNYANAVKYLTPIKEELEHNQIILDVFGALKSDKWSEDEIELTCKKKIICGGNDFKIRGQKYLQYRPDLLVIDDAEDDELVRSQERRENFEHWLIYSLEPAMTQDNNQIIVVGTIIHRDSQLSKLLTGEGKYVGWYSKKYAALAGETALWEEGIPYAWLIQEKSKDPYKFSQEYQNEPVPYEHAMFKESYFDNYQEDALPQNLIINVTVDLACTDKSYSDYTVIMPVGVDTVGDLWILPYIRGKYVDPDEILNNMFKIYEQYSNSKRFTFGKFGIEKVAFQRFLLKNFDKERKKRGLRFQIVEIEAKGDKVTRIAQLQPWFASKDIHIRESMIDLKEELLDFPRARHDDCADSLTMHLSLCDRKPLREIFTEEKWKVTPEGQRNKMMKKRTIYHTPKIYKFN